LHRFFETQTKSRNIVIYGLVGLVDDLRNILRKSSEASAIGFGETPTETVEGAGAEDVGLEDEDAVDGALCDAEDACS
jgi:hypothetical protein